MCIYSEGYNTWSVCVCVCVCECVCVCVSQSVCTLYSCISHNYASNKKYYRLQSDMGSSVVLKYKLESYCSPEEVGHVHDMNNIC